jgi:DNA-binding transcriptional MerR regulator
MSEEIAIGRFAQLSGFTVRALRHYESLGLLLPARVDRDTGYRFYRPEQLPDAQRVHLLRALELPLPDVARVMQAPEGAESLALLRAHRERVASRLRELEREVARLDDWLEGEPFELEREPPALDERASARAGDGEARAEEPVERAFLGLFGPPG